MLRNRFCVGFIKVFIYLFFSGPVDHAVSLKQVLQHMEACPDLTHFGLCGIRKWSSSGLTGLTIKKHIFNHFFSFF